jgi:asparagine synthase (glutamine-hydrolysing)
LRLCAFAPLREKYVAEMSGIVGIINLDGAPVDRDLLSRMTDYMAFRGPDAQEICFDGNIGLGHTMLRTTCEAENEKQPVTLDGKVWLTADARIDGREELIKKLQAKLTTKESPNDAELILYAYEAWGEDCLKHLIGDFAFAIWDSRSKSLFCARDHFGVKPFFFTRISNAFIFSNTLNALRLDPRVSDELNEIAIGDYLLFGVNQDLSTTTFSDIQRLAPAHSLTVSKKTIKTHRYWTPAFTSELRFPDRRSYVECFSELLSTAIRDRLRADRVAVSMSGGLDSTSVAAIARRDAAVHAFAVVYDSLIPDQERYYSTAAAAHIGIPVTHLDADQYTLFEERVSGDMDQPEPFLLSPLTGQFNDLLRLCAGFSRVGLSGWDGDAFMNEPPGSYFAAPAKEMKLKELAANMAWYVWTQRGLPPIGFRTRIKKLFRNHPDDDSSLPDWLDDSFAARTSLRERLKKLTAPDHSDHPLEMRPAARHALNSKIWTSLFEGYDPGATRLHLEMRHPFIDLRLVEFLLAIPPVPWFVNKHILRRAMRDQLPAVVIDRPKTALAGDPALQLARSASVRWLDSFEVNPQLSSFVNLKRRRSIADEQNSDALWASLRVFALNHWLTHSQPIDQRKSQNQVNEINRASTSIA